MLYLRSHAGESHALWKRDHDQTCLLAEEVVIPSEEVQDLQFPLEVLAFGEVQDAEEPIGVDGLPQMGQSSFKHHLHIHGTLYEIDQPRQGVVNIIRREGMSDTLDIIILKSIIQTTANESI